MPRNKKYDWSDKKDLCYRLYIEEERTLPQLQEYFAQALGVAEDRIPSSQTFNRQFREWGFPTRWSRMPPEVEAKTVERIKQLWELNHRNGEIAAFMQNEGFDISEQRIGILRRKHGFVLRNERNFATTEKQKAKGNQQTAITSTAETHQAQYVFNAVEDFSGLQQQHPQQYQQQQQHQQPVMAAGDFPYQMIPEHNFAAQMETPDNSRKRTHAITEDGEDSGQGKKRRRRIRGHVALPPDAPGAPPRYKSETSLNECKAYLQLDNERYQTVRQQFMDICNEMNIQKKTKCEAGQWEASKDRLIRENLHLNAVMHIPHPNPHEVSNALEVICADVTKRIRVINSTISIQDANNGLQLNPAESKHIRHLFYQMLEQDGYTTRTEYDDERWEQMFALWLTKSEILVRLQQQGIDDQKSKFLRVLTRDAMKRLTDFNVKNDPARRNWAEGTYGPGPPPARPKKVAKPAKATGPKASKKRGAQNVGAISLDPELSMFAPAPPVPSPIPLPVEAEFHLAPESRLVGYHPEVWTGELFKCSVPGLHKAGTGKTGAARVGRVFGIVKTTREVGEAGNIVADGMAADEGGDKYVIETDNDLVAYLHTAKELANEKLVFLIELSGGYA